MKIISSTRALYDAISMVQKVVPSRSSLNILEGILIDADEALTMTGYDLETGIEYRVETEILEKGSIVVNARMLGDIIRKLPEGLVTIETDHEDNFKITCDKLKMQIKGMDAVDYPRIPVVEEVKKMNVPQSLMREMIDSTLFATSNDESRPILNGVNVQLERDDLTLVAIDGYRFAVRKASGLGSDEEMNFIVPKRAMQEASRIMEAKEEMVAIYPSHNHILFETSHVSIVSRLIKGDFLQYEKVLPDGCSTKLMVSTKDMLEAVERAALVIKDEIRRFPVTFCNEGEREMKVSARTDIGEIEEFIAMEDFQGERVDIDFNPRFLTEALRHIEDEKIILEFNGHTAPCILKPVEGDAFLYLILPLRR